MESCKQFDGPMLEFHGRMLVSDGLVFMSDALQHQHQDVCCALLSPLVGAGAWQQDLHSIKYCRAVGQ